MNPKFTTNYQPRDVLYWWNLTDAEQREFDYLVPKDYWSADKIREREDGYSTGEGFDDDPCNEFMRYRGVIYDLHEFERWPDGLGNLPKYFAQDKAFVVGFRSDSYFSGVFIWYEDDNFEEVRAATVIW